MSEITELGLENEDGSFPLLHCAFDTISVDILQLNSSFSREQVK